MLTDAQSLGQATYLVIAQLDDAEREARIQLAAPVELNELQTDFAHAISQHARIEWNSRDSVVTAVHERNLGALILDSRRIDNPDSEQVLRAMLKGIRELGLSALTWTPAAHALRTRMLFAQRHDLRAPQVWPAVDDVSLLSDLEVWLAPWLPGITRRSQLAQVNIHDALLALLDWNQQQRLNEIAPTHIDVPSGSRIALNYDGDIPTLSVRLQEVFGMLATPRVGGGAVPVLMELLSPARRPVQVTQDLASFWARGYHEVKKDLKGRYPKHYWPDDPLQAQATARAKPRGT
jgi:ATP-dependent helicase HrpB